MLHYSKICTLILSLSFITYKVESSVEDKGDESLTAGTERAEASDSKGLPAEISDLSSLTSATTSRRQLDAGTLDAKVVKALKKQEEKREKRTTRKKEVCKFEQHNLSLK